MNKKINNEFLRLESEHKRRDEIYKLTKSLLLTALVVFLFMSLFEYLKEKIFPDISLWESHIETIIFTTIVAVFAAFFALRKYQTLCRILSGLIPICIKCKKIRDKNSEWISPEKYIKEHSKATFTHGLCPKCKEDYYKEIERINKSPQKRYTKN